jgi:antitoxin component YwqK of YwqJK toxin-antitoxin module
MLSLIKGLLNGHYDSDWNFGKIRMTGNYKDNQRLGKWISYHQNGMIIESEGA